MQPSSKQQEAKGEREEGRGEIGTRRRLEDRPSTLRIEAKKEFASSGAILKRKVL